MQETTLLNRQEAADALRVSLRTLDQNVKTRRIGHVRLGTGKGRVLFRPVDLETFAARHARPASVHAVMSAI